MAEFKYRFKTNFQVLGNTQAMRLTRKDWVTPKEISKEWKDIFYLTLIYRII